MGSGPSESVVDSIMGGQPEEEPQESVVDPNVDQELPEPEYDAPEESQEPLPEGINTEMPSEELPAQEPLEPEEEEPQEASKTIPQKKKPTKKMKFKNYRYRTRMLKGSILPILFGLISFQMINSSRMQFPDYYELEPMFILAGFVLGFISISSITIMNLVKAKGDPKNGYKLNMKVGLVAYVPFIAIFLGITLFVSLSSGWKFATGFFLASIFPIIFIVAFEASSKGKFFIKEAVNDPSWGRKLIFKH
jgi:hypothetical protein